MIPPSTIFNVVKDFNKREFTHTPSPPFQIVLAVFAVLIVVALVGAMVIPA